MLANAASNLFLSDDFSHDKFYVQLIYRSSIPDNITNWRVFEDNKQIINFLHSEETLKGSFIDDEQHEYLLQASASKEKIEHSNIIPKKLLGWRNCLIFGKNLEDQPIQKLAAQHYYMKLLILVLSKIQRISILERTIHMPRE